MVQSEDSSSSNLLKWNWKIFAGISLVSVVYFVDIFLKASRKCFWFDELFTVYLCRLPSFRSTWEAVSHGADFNPPLLYLMTRGAQQLFGCGLIATRLPSAIGVWLFGFCLFLFVARRAGATPGLIAGIFPFFTLAQYYAYEARAHGIVLGWCGIALVCWQRNGEDRAKHLWLAGFGVALLGALLTHVYAICLLVPFALVELYNLLRGRQLNWGRLGVMLSTSSSVLVAVYLPLLRVYRASVPSTFRLGGHELFQRFLAIALGPALIVLLLYLFLSVMEAKEQLPRETTAGCIPKGEIILAVGFACIPFAGLLGSKVTHGPFIDRYFLSSIAAYAIILGFASSRWRVKSWTTQALAGCMLSLMVADLAISVYLLQRQRIVLVEPSVGLVLSTTPADPMRLYETLKEDRNGLDILILPELEYLYFFHYAPPSVVPHLYFGAPANDLFLAAYERLASGTHLPLQMTTFDPFLSSHRRFLVYEGRNATHPEAIEALANGGYTLRSARTDAAGILYEYAR